MSQVEAKRTQGYLWGFLLKYVVHLLIVIVAVQGLPFWKLGQGQQRFQGTSALERILDRLGCSTAEAGEVSVFGSKKYIRTTGKPNIYTDRFSTQAGKGTVVVVNGGADGSHRVSSAIITLNGRVILKTKDFNQNVYRLRVAVDLAVLNTLVVELRSKPDSYLMIEVLAEQQNTPPTADAGPDQTVFAGDTVTLDGSASSDVDGDPLTFTWSFASVPPGSTAALSAPSAIKPTFVPDKPGTYVAQLIVNDGKAASTPDTINVIANIRMTNVPDVAGLPQASAESAITAAHLAVGTITQVNSATIPAGNVISQAPPADSSVAEGSSVNLVISLGSAVRQVGPEGGIFEFPNGVILDIPPGAVNEMVNIEITDLSCEEVDAIILSQQLATHQKRCLRGFSAKPDGLVFNVPIKAIVPVTLEPGEIPVRIGVDVNNHVQWTINAELVYRGNEGVIEMSMEHFSEEYLAAVAARKNEREQQCKRCETYIPYIHGEVWCGPLDVPNPISGGLQPGACQLLEAEREEQDCKVDGLKCCMEELMHIKVTDADFISGECKIVGGKLDVTFTTCDGSPTITDSMGEVGCPEGTILELEILSDKPWIHACETANLKATLTATSPDGRVLFKGAPFPADYSITAGDPDIAKLGAGIPPNGVVVEGGREAGDVQIHASAIGAEDKISADYTLTVISNIDSFSVTPSQAIIKVGEGRILQAEIIGAEGILVDASTVSWSSSDPTTAAVIPTGEWTSVEGADCGQVTITAEYSYRCETVQRKAMVTVEDRVSSCQVNPSAITLSVGEFAPLEVTPLDANGNEVTIDLNTVRWSSSIPDIASASPSVGLLTGVRANQIGDSAITATYSWSNRCGQKSCQAQVRVNCEKCTFRVTPPAQELVLGSSGTTLTAELRDVNGEPVNIPFSTLDWKSDSSVVSLTPTTDKSKIAVTPVSEGTATITATYTYTDTFGQKTKTATATITVTAPPKTWYKWPQLFGPNVYDILLGADGQGNVFARWIEMVEYSPPCTGSTCSGWSPTKMSVGKVDPGGITVLGAFELAQDFGNQTPDYYWPQAFFVDTQGNLIVVYTVEENIWCHPGDIIGTDCGAFPKTWARRYNANGVWDDTTVMLAHPVADIHVAADNSGNAIIVWTDEGTLWALRYDAVEGWQSRTQIAATIPSGSRPKIAMDSSGNAMLVWMEYDAVNRNSEIWANRYRIGSGWMTESIRIAAPDIVLINLSLNIVMNSTGNAIVTWYNLLSGIWAKHFDVNAGWQPSIKIADNPSIPSDSSGSGVGLPYKIAMNDGGNAMIVFRKVRIGQVEESLMSKRYVVNQGWDENGTLIQDIFTDERIAEFSLNGDDNATLISGYRYVPTNSMILYTYAYARQYREGKGWEIPVLYSGEQELDSSYRNKGKYSLVPGSTVVDGFGNATIGNVWPNYCTSLEVHSYGVIGCAYDAKIEVLRFE